MFVRFVKLKNEAVILCRVAQSQLWVTLSMVKLYKSISLLPVSLSVTNICDSRAIAD